MIPKRLYMNWHTLPIDALSQACYKRWYERLPSDWEMKIWTHEDEHLLPYPELFKYAANYAEWSDICRMQTLAMGSVYADLDSVPGPAFSVDEILATDNLITYEVFRPGEYRVNSWETGNWFLAGCEDSEFWHHICQQLPAWIEDDSKWRTKQELDKGSPTLWKTGPRGLALWLREWRHWIWSEPITRNGAVTRADVTMWPPAYTRWAHRDIQNPAVSETVRVIHRYGGLWSHPQSQWKPADTSNGGSS
jgi:hypothetical protein